MLAIIDRVDMDAMAAYAEARGYAAAGCLDCVARAGRLCGCDGCDNGAQGDAPHCLPQRCGVLD